jgi:hypothetical protein
MYSLQLTDALPIRWNMARMETYVVLTDARHLWMVVLHGLQNSKEKASQVASHLGQGVVTHGTFVSRATELAAYTALKYDSCFL